jgi:hypothetical protein
VQELWRNFRDLPFRGSTNRYDYLRDFSEHTSAIFQGAGFESEFHLADFCRHWAADIPQQLDFHMRYFREEKATPDCFTYINFYPRFDVWGYRVETDKAEEGWTCLRDVTENGFGLYTRFRFPYGKPCGNYDVTVTTPAIYAPLGTYGLSTYHYESGNITSTTLQADQEGKLQIASSGGRGHEIGISGNGLTPPILFLTDTLHENLYIESGRSVSLSFKVVNLSPYRMDSVVFTCRAGHPGSLRVQPGTKAYDLEPGKVTILDDLVTLRGRFTSPNHNLAYLHIGYHHKGDTSSRERLIQVHITDTLREVSRDDMLIFDGRSEALTVYRYNWGDWDNRVRLETITEGQGNGNGIAEPGELFSIWIKIPTGDAPEDVGTWHPVVPISGEGSMDIHVESIREYLFSTGRPSLSAQMRLPATYDTGKRNFLHVQSELIWMQPAADCHRGSVDRIFIRYFRLPINSTSIFSKSASDPGMRRETLGSYPPSL